LLPQSDLESSIPKFDFIDNVVNKDKIIIKENNVDDSLNEQENWNSFLNDEFKKRRNKNLLMTRYLIKYRDLVLNVSAF